MRDEKCFVLINAKYDNYEIVTDVLAVSRQKNKNISKLLKEKW